MTVSLHGTLCVRSHKSTLLREKIEAALHFFASAGGYRETAAAMRINKGYVIDIVDDVARVLNVVAGDVTSFPNCHEGWDDTEENFRVLQVSSGLCTDSMSVEVRPGSWLNCNFWKYSKMGRHTGVTIRAGTHFIDDSGYTLFLYMCVLFEDREEGSSRKK
ncbi:hypothetical protein PHMEG_00017590 [Phytophthora megakarya]|uniref:DDE Tnp4 domain-containing protein n=1 Tax=Phytophthora megakarya TaxID=4795 RepID=A0A225VXI5_9STRA|nr:hypothetical protein PHMEG_00017590 [Phytophthora megakarya]